MPLHIRTFVTFVGTKLIQNFIKIVKMCVAVMSDSQTHTLTKCQTLESKQRTINFKVRHKVSTLIVRSNWILS